jgi:hypothetical protein
MTDLTPAAEAVLNAVTLTRYDVPYYACPKSIDQIKSDVAAALRAAADQVVPENLSEYETYTNEAIRLNLQAVRRKFHAIADELEDQ